MFKANLLLSLCSLYILLTLLWLHKSIPNHKKAENQILFGMKTVPKRQPSSVFRIFPAISLLGHMKPFPVHECPGTHMSIPKTQAYSATYEHSHPQAWHRKRSIICFASKGWNACDKILIQFWKIKMVPLLSCTWPLRLDVLCCISGRWVHSETFQVIFDACS